MRRCTIAAAIVLFLAGADQKANAPKFGFIDLKEKANHKLDEAFHSGAEGNHLGELPKGEQTFEGVKFKIGDKLIQLGSKLVENMPEKVEGIKVDKTFTTLHILHATGYGGGPNEEGTAYFVPDDTLIGRYHVHYEDGVVEVIPIVYGKDVRDWWWKETEKSVPRAKIAWKGDNDRAKAGSARIRLYLTSWHNPKPHKKVTHIDYSSTFDKAAPFCVALTAEGK